jgi:hypothetical protein
MLSEKLVGVDSQHYRCMGMNKKEIGLTDRNGEHKHHQATNLRMNMNELKQEPASMYERMPSH